MRFELERQSNVPSVIAIRIAAVVALPFSLAAPLVAQAPDNPFLRWQFFYEQRAFPGNTIPVGAMQRARAELTSRWPDVILRRGTGDAAAFELESDAWTPIGPAPIDNGSAGRISTVAVHPADPATIYIGGAQGGVWKSTDSGASWTPLTDGECSLAMGSIAIDPVDPDIVYAGTGELHFSADSYYGCGVLRTTDGGLTWTRLGAAAFAASTGGARISRVLIDASTAGSTTATTVYAAASNGLWVSRDSGLSWTMTLAGVISDLQFDASGPSTLYAAVGLPSTQSTNGVLKSTDSGSSWNRLAAFPTADVGRIALASSPSSPGIVYAAIQDGFNNGSSDGQLLGIWRTVDGGNTWAERQAAQANCNTQCWYDLVIAIDPTDDNTIWFGGVPLYRSTDGANTFLNVLRSAHVDQHAITFDPSDPSTVYIGNDGGVWRSRDGAITWQSLNAGLAITQFYAGISMHPTDTTVVLGGTQDNGTLEAGGSDIWRLVLGGDGGFTAIDYIDPRYAWAETQWTAGSGFAGPRRRFGSGPFDRLVSGIDTNDRALFIPPLVMHRTDPATLYFGTYRLYRTTNRGVLWGAISPDLTLGSTTNGRISAIAPSESDAGTVWVGTSDGQIHVTTDGGVTWTLRNGGLPRRFVTDIALDALDPDIAVATVSGFDTGHVFRTVDGGVTWTDISGILPNIPVNAALMDPAIGGTILIGTDLGVFRTIDNGSFWEPFVDGLPNVAIYDLAYNRSTGIAVAATHGRSVYAFRPTAASVIAVDVDAVVLTSIGDTARINAVAFDLDGDTISNVQPVWRTADPTVAVVDASGLVTAVSNGETSVVASFAGVADTAQVVVRQVAVDILDMPVRLDLVEGETRIVTPRAVDALGRTVGDAVITLTSADPAVASVGAGGTVRGVGAGTTVVTASTGQITDASTVQVSVPSSATLDAAPAQPSGPPQSSAGARLSLLRLNIAVTGVEAMRITGIGFTVTGDDPRATLFVLRDTNGNGLADDGDTVVVGAPVNLQEAPVDVTLEPADMRIDASSSVTFIVALELSGAVPNGATFQATYLPERTVATGVRSGSTDRITLPPAPVQSVAIASTVLGAEEFLTFSENPVRSDRVIFNFRETPTVAAIYTITGRRVADLTRRVEGADRVEWDLRNDDGERVAPGVYLVIFDIGGTVMRERLFVLPPRDTERDPADGSGGRSSTDADTTQSPQGLQLPAGRS